MVFPIVMYEFGFGDIIQPITGIYLCEWPGPISYCEFCAVKLISFLKQSLGNSSMFCYIFIILLSLLQVCRLVINGT